MTQSFAEFSLRFSAASPRLGGEEILYDTCSFPKFQISKAKWLKTDKYEKT